MGYTHYWRLQTYRIEFSESVFLKINQVLTQHRNIIGLDEHSDMPPICTLDTIKFNGHKNDGHEDFWFFLKPNKEEDPYNRFDFCKTERKPYDIPVCKILLILKEYLKDAMILSTDVGINEWHPIFQELCEQNLLGSTRIEINQDGNINLA